MFVVGRARCYMLIFSCVRSLLIVVCLSLDGVCCVYVVVRDWLLWVVCRCLLFCVLCLLFNV